ncbi:hypothetical protein CQA49_04540 [Helicobacter sp. MIT 00-7814]|uniref:hypothetical protein n=1 Tax=unclassified Helicobacter TaxID=2593540 RepID=UPI000E1E6222|nr:MULTISPECIES: hypothetical protein [unclassified Helicobacter]RDU54839.1 hypothetical protein CQA37_05025 [Helicobacter sp. MIT 99-10781]RDU54897.1 hypothetical protein CQA49_04540 [Helicobacter sp. MIT 00-7814]
MLVRFFLVMAFLGAFGYAENIEEYCNKHIQDEDICLVARNEANAQTSDNPYTAQTLRQTTLTMVQGMAGFDELESKMLSLEKKLSKHKNLKLNNFKYCENVEPYFYVVLSQLGATTDTQEQRVAKVCGKPKNTKGKK